MTVKNTGKRMTTSFKSWKNGILALAGCLCAIQPAAAQQALNSVEVLVNDEPITSFDIDQRLRLVIAISGGIRTEEEFLRVREQVIRSMVDEKLEIQEAKQFELEISDAELESYFARRSQASPTRRGGAAPAPPRPAFSRRCGERKGPFLCIRR